MQVQNVKVFIVKLTICCDILLAFRMMGEVQTTSSHLTELLIDGKTSDDSTAMQTNHPVKEDNQEEKRHNV